MLLGKPSVFQVSRTPFRAGGSRARTLTRIRSRRFHLRSTMRASTCPWSHMTNKLFRRARFCSDPIQARGFPNRSRGFASPREIPTNLGASLIPCAPVRGLRPPALDNARPDLSDSEGVPEAGPRPITRESAISISPVSQFRDRHFHDIGFRDSDGALIWPR